MVDFSEDMWPGTNDGDEGEPDWVKTEREQFSEHRDKDKDGLMNRDEVRDWVMPDDYDHSKAEAKHLIYQADNDKVWTTGEMWELCGCGRQSGHTVEVRICSSNTGT